jgi:hypothetical protein
VRNGQTASGRSECASVQGRRELHAKLPNKSVSCQVIKIDHLPVAPQELAAAAIGDGARAKCSKRPASFWAKDKAVPLGGVVAVVVAESPD